MRTIMALAVLAIACGVEAQSMKIVENGKSDCAIWLAADASPVETFAANELAKYVKRMSGAKLEIRRGGSLPDKCIVIGTGNGVNGDAYSIKLDGDKLYVSGGRGRSVLYAVYDLLDRLGCRFLAPDFAHYQGSNEIIPKRRDLTLDLPCPVTEKPVLAIRKLYVEEGHSHNAENLIQMADWMPKARFSMLVIPTDYQDGGRVKWDNWRETVTPELRKRDITIEVGGHGYQNFLNAEMEGGKLFDQHQDWFGMDEKGEGARSHGRVFCTSNSDAVAYLANNVIAYLKPRPEIQVFAFWPPDGARWCECAKCKALGTPSNRQAILISQVKAALRKAGLDTRLETIAYHLTVSPPESAKLEKDLLIDFCPIAQCFEVQINDASSTVNADYVKQLRGLRKGFEGDLSIYSYYRKYAWKSLPNLIPHYVQKDLQFYATIPTQGISSYAEPGDWFAYELNHYVLGNLAWNPNADVDALIAKFAEARYGSASRAAVSTYAVLEDVVRHNCDLPGTSLKSAEELTKAESRIEEQAKSLKTAQSEVTDTAIKRNIERLLLTLEYARLDIEVQKARAAKLSADEIKARVKVVADLLAAHADDGVFVVHSRVEYPRILKTYGVD